MGRYIGAVCRLCRRQGEKLFLKGTKCQTEKCAAAKRAYPPGQHGQGRRQKLSNYGVQLKEKQKVKRIYGVLERQFRKYFEVASKTKGVTGKVLLQLLERRLDNVVFRMGMGISRSQARQIVRHNLIAVNSRRVNIPSYLVDKDDLVEIKAKDKVKIKIKDNLELSKDRTVPSWLEFSAAEMKGKVLRLPEKTDIQQPIQEQLIVELYSK
ncbi:MAG: 30S ribosomal protein S4 [Candidatus Omnitrophica bacterium]|nr:30S ribosomal protein S4 [Candidatus Omnitrophota bacterium]MBU4303906.1 30S ribosomal protein S4 [Candidatus Omnitrophota bacterium]MBU4418725.1 30S ribosomal protein S4 [Candidatus Omnitrophota bacterium]MBU4468083.1 30S ribosomal protein S4 [Candidatus Omnitrophota bacterium]MCG2707858.1 30S ribosomal protein S4 [Candidatus Omnitrophota bacterium]